MIVKVLQSKDDKLWAGLNSKIKHVCGDETLFLPQYSVTVKEVYLFRGEFLPFGPIRRLNTKIGGWHLAFSPSLLYRGEGWTANTVFDLLQSVSNTMHPSQIWHLEVFLFEHVTSQHKCDWPFITSLVPYKNHISKILLSQSGKILGVIEVHPQFQILRSIPGYY